MVWFLYFCVCYIIISISPANIMCSILWWCIKRTFFSLFYTLPFQYEWLDFILWKCMFFLGYALYRHHIVDMWCARVCKRIGCIHTVMKATLNACVISSRTILFKNPQMLLKNTGLQVDSNFSWVWRQIKDGNNRIIVPSSFKSYFELNF